MLSSLLLQLRQLLRKGIPRELRSEVWQLFLNSHTLKAQSTFDYQVGAMSTYMNLCMSAVHGNVVLSVLLMCTTTVCKVDGGE